MMTGRPIIYDSRWMGPHGIGRFATELNNRLPCLSEQSLSGSPTSPFDSFRLSLMLWKHDGLFFSPGFNAPLTWPYSTSHSFVFTIHDLIHVNFPAEASLAKQLYYRHIVRPATRRAFKVLTVSEFSKQQIVVWAGIDPTQVEVVYNGVGNAFTLDGPKLETDYDYLLYVGNQKPHKNVDGLLAALARVRETTQIHLAITGDATIQTKATVESLGLSNCVHFLGRMTDDQLAAAYRGARITVLASHYEGFGLPVIESMACGTPVVCSNTTSLPEVAGDAAVLVETNSESIASGILRLLQNDSLCNSLSSAGHRRAAAFTWEATAAKVSRVLEQLAQSQTQQAKFLVKPIEASAD